MYKICTHVHFDHVGGAHSFGPDAQIMMGGAAQAFTKNYELTSLGAAHSCPVQPFKISHWLGHGDRVPLATPVADAMGFHSDERTSDDMAISTTPPSGAANATAASELQVLHIPGHTPDHIALWWEDKALLFVGDHIYPWTAVDISCLGHSLPDFIASTELLLYEAPFSKLQYHTSTVFIIMLVQTSS